MKKVIILILLLLNSPLVYADLIKINCVYTSYSNEKGNFPNELKIEFNIDSVTKKAVMIGNAGMADVMVVKNKTGLLTFIEVTPDGNVMTTSIDKENNSSHSRPTIVKGKLYSSQNYGKCTVKGLIP